MSKLKLIGYGVFLIWCLFSFWCFLTLIMGGF